MAVGAGRSSTVSEPETLDAALHSMPTAATGAPAVIQLSSQHAGSPGAQAVIGDMLAVIQGTLRRVAPGGVAGSV